MTNIQGLDESALGTHTDCWNTIGVFGGASCRKLATYSHCRNCRVYSAAAESILDAEPTASYLRQCTEHVAQETPPAEIDRISVFVFRIDDEWFGLPTTILEEVVGIRTVHTVPHRRNGVLLGLANISGVLLPCFSLQHVLGLERALPAEKAAGKHILHARMLVIQRGGSRAACPVSEVHGIVHFIVRNTTPVPATIAKANAAYTRSALNWQERLVGLLDDEMLFNTIDRSLA